MARNSSTNRGKNNNPEGHNQYNNGWMDTAKDKPFTTAAAAAAAVGAGVFLWSRRNQISGQISNLSDQISDWSQSMRAGNGQASEEFALAGDTGTFEEGSSGKSSKKASGRGNGRSGRGMSESGGGNASLGAQTGSTGVGAAS